MKIFNYKLPKFFVYGSAFAATFGAACLIKESMGGKKYNADVSAEGKVVVVTGANTGIGKQTAWDLARRGAKVYMACRNLKKCEKAREEIVLDTRNQYVYCRLCDLASLESVRQFASLFNKQEKELHVLINNAGVMRTKKGSKTKEGFEMQLGVNHFGHFLLTNLLLDKLKASAPSRIINVSSVTHKKGVINKEDLNSDKSYDPGKAYSQSKLANILFTQKLAEKLEGTKVTVNAVHPGFVDSEIMRHMSFFNSWLAAIFIKPFVWPFIKSPRQGCRTIVYLALDAEVENISGKYFCDYEDVPVGPSANDEKTASWLWAVSEKWTRF